MSESELVELEEEIGLSRRDLFVKGGVIAAGATVLGGPTAAAFGAVNATAIKVAVVTHGDTGSFWSVFKKGVDQAAKDLQGPRRQRHAGLREQRRLQAGRRDQRRDRREGAKVIATSVPDASALKDPLTKASRRGS